MRIAVQLFARLHDLAGTRAMQVDVPSQSTVRDVWAAVIQAAPAVAAMAGAVTAAVNEDFATMATVVRDGDDVAFLPPVSGGSSSDGRVQDAR